MVVEVGFVWGGKRRGSGSDAGDLVPVGTRCQQDLPRLGSSQLVAPWTEIIPNGPKRLLDALCMRRRFEAVPGPLPLAGCLMAVLELLLSRPPDHTRQRRVRDCTDKEVSTTAAR
ncbi:MAG: hypothetical protein JWO42_3084 [Chloroflexi bacterium]|nr:hypothetical protein [Chloroflexota bacterium]